MPINWEEFDRDIDAIIDSSAEATDDRFASRISSLTRMTDEEVKELVPRTADARKLKELVKIVKSSEERNVKVNRIASNSEEFAGIVLSLLQKFI